MFSGASQINVDAKGRLAIPTKYRENIARACEGNMVITLAPTGDSLWMYSQPVWQDIMRKLVALPSEDAASERLRQILIGFADEVKMDGSGRVLIGKSLRDRAKISKETWLTGQGNKFVIWQAETWEKRLDEMCNPDSGKPTSSEFTKELSL